MISDEQQEQATLYALGLLDADEADVFERALADDAELRGLVAELRETASAIALAAGPETVQPPAGLKERLLAEVTRAVPVALAPPTRPASPPRTTWRRWPLVAAAAVLVCFLWWDRAGEIVGMTRLQNEVEQQALTIQQLKAAQERYLDERSVTPLMRMAVCHLEPTPDGPEQPRAAVVWDPSHHQGRLIITRLKPPAGGKDYQLWAVEEGHADPVSAGVIHVDNEGKVTTEFKPDDAGNEKVAAFALSLEPAGGSVKARGPILLLGKF